MKKKNRFHRRNIEGVTEVSKEKHGKLSQSLRHFEANKHTVVAFTEAATGVSCAAPPNTL